MDKLKEYHDISFQMLVCYLLVAILTYTKFGKWDLISKIITTILTVVWVVLTMIKTYKLGQEEK